MAWGGETGRVRPVSSIHVFEGSTPSVNATVTRLKEIKGVPIKWLIY
jgi:hypothetical protein